MKLGGNNIKVKFSMENDKFVFVMEKGSKDHITSVV